MINQLIAWSLRNRFLVFCGVALLIGFGVRAVYRTPVDAIPDLSENRSRALDVRLLAHHGEFTGQGG